MASSVRTHAPWLALLGGAVGAALFSATLLPEPSAIDHALPWIAAVVAVCAWMSRGTAWGTFASLAVTLLPLAPLATGNQNARLLVYGVSFAVAIVAAVAPRVRDDLRRNEGIALLLLVALPFRLIGADGRTGVIGIVIVAGCAALLWLRPSWSLFLIAAAAAIATPADPWRVALFP